MNGKRNLEAPNLHHLQWRIQDFSEVGTPPLQGRAPTYDFAKFSQKLHEIERIWIAKGARVPRALPP